MTDLQKYLNYKMITSIINSDEVFEKIDLYSSTILNIDFITCIDAFCEVYIDKNKLDKKQVSRFKNLVNYIMDNINIPKEKYINIINKIISSINQTNYINKSQYCVENYMSRFRGHNYYKIFYNPFVIPEVIEKIKVSASKDYFFLSLLTQLTDEEFYYSLGFVLLDEYFLLSVNQIISEMPELLENKTFVTRIKIITEENLKQINEIEDKKEKIILYKESKYYAKHLKEE